MALPYYFHVFWPCTYFSNNQAFRTCTSHLTASTTNQQVINVSQQTYHSLMTVFDSYTNPKVILAARWHNVQWPCGIRSIIYIMFLLSQPGIEPVISCMRDMLNNHSPTSMSTMMAMITESECEDSEKEMTHMAVFSGSACFFDCVTFCQPFGLSLLNGFTLHNSGQHNCLQFLYCALLVI